MSKIYKMADLILLIRRSESSIRRDVKDGRFPPPVRLGTRSIGWVAADIEAWLKQLKEAA